MSNEKPLCWRLNIEGKHAWVAGLAALPDDEAAAIQAVIVYLWGMDCAVVQSSKLAKRGWKMGFAATKADARKWLDSLDVTP